ncbi:hypothetical protein OSB04_008524 [Centaurea solstitialis]|uniref:Prolyl endopeptidase n=1 Tax=Centaurea solstitialis TaxID=347529 RepID=A0AA38TNP4_9ASTR|nr:hypothetical protein OSB04_008524 [Centaurea solstitialis]
MDAIRYAGNFQAEMTYVHSAFQGCLLTLLGYSYTVADLTPTIFMASFIFLRSSIKQTKHLLPFTHPITNNTPTSYLSSLRHQNHRPPPPPPPPVAKKVPFEVSTHGVSWQDPYHWMSNTHHPDFLNYLHHENSYSNSFMADTHKLQNTLYSEMISRLPNRISTPPEPWERKEYPVLCRKLAVESPTWVKHMVSYARRKIVNEEILLDWNEIAKEHGYVHVGTCRVSPDHHFLAYTIDVTGKERFLLQVKDLQSGCIIPSIRIEDVVSLAWAQDSRTLFYTVQYTMVGSNPLSDVIVYTEKDPSFCVDITSTKDGKFITVYVVDASNPKDSLRKIHDRVSGVQFFLEHHRGFFYILTNAQLRHGEGLLDGNYYLARCHVEDAKLTNWQKIVVPKKGSGIQDMDVFDEHLVLYLNGKDSPIICSIRMPIPSSDEKETEIDDLDPWYFPLPSNSCSVVPGSNHDFTNSVYRVVLSSPVMPDLIVDYDMSRRTFSIVHQEEVLGISSKTDNEAHEWMNISDAYSCERKEVISEDGTIVPLTILYSHKAHKMGQSPGILHGYGSYGEVLDKSWCAERLSLLDRGWVVAFADVRGGGGDDPSWHECGSGLNKLNSIYDFVSCGDYLIKEGFVHKHQLAAVGHSAGGLLVAAAINMRPELFRAAILKVPFLDICNTLLDPSLPLTVLDYEEFGNPQIKSHFHSIMKYSPYDNISRGTCYPALLVTASFHDSRVGVWEAAKYVARIRETTCSKCSHSVILKTNMSGGHFGEGGRSGQCEELAYEYAFLMKVMDRCSYGSTKESRTRVLKKQQIDLQINK